MSATQPSKPATRHQPTAPPRYSLRPSLGVWRLTFDGHEAILKHQRGIAYVAYLLSHPQPEPIHALALALKAEAEFSPASTAPASQPTAASTGAIPAEADRQGEDIDDQLEEARTAWSIRRQQLELEALLEDETQSEPVKAEALRELEAIYHYQETSLGRMTALAQHAARAVRTAIERFHRRLRCARDLPGHPDPMLQEFASHLQLYLLAPSARCSAQRVSRLTPALAGRFAYQPPPGVVWEN
jgi:hypothetical protein